MSDTSPEAASAPIELHTDDLDGIRARGVLRVLVERDEDGYLPRSGDPLLHERELAERFAESIGVEMTLVAVDSFSELLPSLRRGYGDLVAANLTITPERADSVAFSVPLDHSVETLVLAAEGRAPKALDELTGRLGVRESTTFERTAHALRAKNPKLEVLTYPGNVDADAVLDSVAVGSIDYTIQDSNRLDILLDYRTDIQRGLPVSERQSLAWAVRKDATRLKEALDEFLNVHYILGDLSERYVEDLPELRRKRKKLRMITHNSATTYFLWRGRLVGFEYDLAKQFAKSQGLQLEVVVAPEYSDLLRMLRSGEGDFVAAFLTPLASRRDSLVTFTEPYHYASEVLVGPSDATPLDDLSGLAGKSIAVRPSSSYRETLERIRERDSIEFEIVDVPESMETESIIAAVAEGRYDFTVADSHILELEMTIRDDIQGLFQLSEAGPRAWAIQPANEELLRAANAFLKREYRSAFYNLTYQKYFARARRFASDLPEGTTHHHLSPYDDLVQELALQHGYDWRLVVSQMFQESGFDAGARSWVGAMGLMQLMPETARELGVTDPDDPRQSIDGGLRHLSWLRQRFPHSLEADEQLWFALASYNAGHGHVRDARRLASALKLDPNIWFENVERAMLKLSEREYFAQARHGYVRGTEPVDYVRKIRARYRAYVNLLNAEAPAEIIPAGD